MGKAIFIGQPQMQQPECDCQTHKCKPVLSGDFVMSSADLSKATGHAVTLMAATSLKKSSICFSLAASCLGGAGPASRSAAE